MNAEQLSHLIGRAESGTEAALKGDKLCARMFADTLHGYWSCAMSFDDFVLADTAYRGVAWIDAAIAFQEGRSYVVRLNNACLYGRAA